jgi:vacuolar-type H+-ATPase subunit I/STV1
MSDVQFRIYEGSRKQEREVEKKQKRGPQSDLNELFEEKSSTYRIFSRLFCNFIIPERPVPGISKKKKDPKAVEEEVEEEVKEDDAVFAQLIKEGLRVENKQDVEDDREGEIEGDEVLEILGGESYTERLNKAIQNIKQHSNDFLTPEALETYSPKFLHILENIKDPEYQGLHLIYSQFRTAEGIGLFCKVLDKNGFARFRIKKIKDFY